MIEKDEKKETEKAKSGEQKNEQKEYVKPKIVRVRRIIAAGGHKA